MNINYQILFEKSPGLFLVLDPDFKIVCVSDAYLAATMTKRESIIYKDVFNVFPDNPDDKVADGVNNFKKSLERVIQLKTSDKMPIQKYDIRQASGAFQERYWSPFNSPILDISGNVNFIIHSVEDVTAFIKSKNFEDSQKDENIFLNSLNRSISLEFYERIRQIDKVNLELKNINEVLREKTKLLESSNEELALFAETAAHDIKAPFRSISGYLEIISDKVKDKLNDEEIDKSFIRIRAARKRISNLLDSLLEFARITRSTEFKTKIDLNQLLPEVIANLEFNITEKKANITYPVNFPSINGNYIQIIQLFQNLISNALKFCKETPVVNISFTETEEQVELVIKDNGIGIDKIYHDKIFVPFERLHTFSEYPGTGLGLAICKRIVDQHGGGIWFNANENGTTFYFTLPKI